MKKIQFLTNLMCVFVLGFITQAKAETLDSFLPEKTGIENHTVQGFADYWSTKSDEELLYYVGAQFVWSAKNTRASATESVYDKMKQAGYDNAFGDPAMIREWMSYLERGFDPLTGQVKTAGISSSKAIQPLTRNAYANELPFTFDWNIVEEMSDPEFPLILGTDVDAVNIFSAKCGNPLYPPRVGGGYARVSRTGSTVSTAPPGGFQKQTEELAPVNNYYETNNYYEQETVQRESYDQGYGYSEPRVRVSLNFHGGWLWGNQCCGFGGYSSGYCSHNTPYQTFGYQPYGGGQPNITNPNIYVNVVNNNTNTNTNTNTTTVTNTNNPGNPPGPGGGGGNPADPPNGGNGNPGGPKDPPNGGGRGGSFSGGGTNYANATQSRPRTSQSSGNQTTQSTQGRPRSNSQVGNNSASYSQSSGRPQNQPRGNNLSRPVQQRPVQNQQFSRPEQQQARPQMAYSSGGGQSRSGRR